MFLFRLRDKLIVLCHSCGAMLLPIRGYVGAASGEILHKAVLAPNRVVVMHKTSRLEFERKKHKHLSERQLQTEVRVRVRIESCRLVASSVNACAAFSWIQSSSTIPSSDIYLSQGTWLCI